MLCELKNPTAKTANQSKIKPQTDPKNRKPQKTEYFWMCLDVVLKKPL